MAKGTIRNVVVFIFLFIGVFGVFSYIQYSSVFSTKPDFSGGKIQHTDTSRTFVSREHPAGLHVFCNHNPDKKMAIEWQVALGTLLIAAIGTFVVYVLKTGKNQGEDIVVLKANVSSFSRDVTEIKTDLNQIRSGQRDLNEKLDKFLADEIGILKNLARGRNNGV